MEEVEDLSLAPKSCRRGWHGGEVRMGWWWSLCVLCTLVEVGRWGGAGVEAAWVRGAVFNPKVNARPPWPLGQPHPPPAPDQTQLERQRRYNSSLLFPHRQHDAAIAADDTVQRLTGQPRRLEVCERALHPYDLADASEQTVGRVTTFVGGCMGGFKVRNCVVCGLWNSGRKQGATFIDDPNPNPKILLGCFFHPQAPNEGSSIATRWGRIFRRLTAAVIDVQDGISAEARLLNPSSVAVSPDGAFLLVMDG